jgi:hypothetical protein
MFYFIIKYPSGGWFYSLIVVTPIYIGMCCMIVYISDQFAKRKIDITGIEEMRTIADAQLEKKQVFKRIVKWIMQREFAIFWIGSVYYLDPDYVALLMRKKGESLVSLTKRIIIPSVMISMIFWTSVYWFVYQLCKDYQWAKSVALWLETS